LEAGGYARSRWEKEGVARLEQRPPRRYYELTGAGRSAARDAVSRYRSLQDVGTANPAKSTR
jgi:DNA-binding PadR family transcriptional regulator